MKFYDHIKNVCNKVNSKTALLTKSSCLFPVKFKPTLFKLFVLPHYDYCGSLFMKVNSTTKQGLLIKNFNTSILRFLKINLFNLTTSEQFMRLKTIKILPCVYRQFFHFCTFLYDFKSNNGLVLNDKLNSYLKEHSTTRSIYSSPPIGTDFSFITIGIKLLNFFYLINARLNEKDKFFIKKSKFRVYLLKNIQMCYESTRQTLNMD